MKADVERIPARHESPPGGTTHRLAVVLLQHDPLPGQDLQVWRMYLLNIILQTPTSDSLASHRVVPGDVIVAEVVSQHQDDVGPGWGDYGTIFQGKKAEEERQHSQERIPYQSAVGMYNLPSSYGKIRFEIFIFVMINYLCSRF